MAEVEMSWYVLRAVSGKESKVKEYIDAEIKNGRLGGHVAQVLIPTEKVLQVRGGKRVVKERNYLPGYVLVEARLVGEIAHELRNTPNVLGWWYGHSDTASSERGEQNLGQGGRNAGRGRRTRYAFQCGRIRQGDGRAVQRILRRNREDRQREEEGDGDRQGVRSQHRPGLRFYANREGVRAMLRALCPSNQSQ